MGIQVGSKIRMLCEMPGRVNDNPRDITTIPKGAICTVVDTTNGSVTAEWISDSQVNERVVHHSGQLRNLFKSLGKEESAHR